MRDGMKVNDGFLQCCGWHFNFQTSNKNVHNVIGIHPPSSSPHEHHVSEYVGRFTILTLIAAAAFKKLLFTHLYIYLYIVCQSGEGYCFNGDCPTLANQCEHIWGYGGTAADRQCYDQFNTKGSINGHCGTDHNGKYMTCAPE